jgi:hypothetical protein
MAAEAPEKVTKTASYEKAIEMLPSTILKNGTWDQHSEVDLLKKMMMSIAYLSGKLTTLQYLAGSKGDLICGDKTLSKKDINKLSLKFKEELSKVVPIVMLNITVKETTYKTPMSLCWVDPTLREFFMGNKSYPRANLGKVYEMHYSPMEQLLMKKIGERRQILMQERYAKSGLPDAKTRPLETFVYNFEIPKSSESSSHVFTPRSEEVVEAAMIAGGWSTHSTISALLSLYFRFSNLNIKMRPHDDAVRETPKVKFDARMTAFFGKAEYDEEQEADGKRRKKPGQGGLFSDADMSEKGIGYLQMIQRLTSKYTKKRKSLKAAQLDEYDRIEHDVRRMEQIQKGTKAALETKRYYKEVAELEKKAERASTGV